MEEAIDALKDFILTNYNTYLEALDTPDVPLIPLEERNLAIGVIDSAKYSGAHVMSIMPQGEDYTDLTLGENEAELLVEVYIFVKKANPSTIYRQVMKYAACFKQMVYDDPSLNESVSDAKIIRMEYFEGVEGSQDSQAVMIQLVLNYEYEI